MGSELQSEFYEMSAKSICGKEVKMKDFEGKTVIVVNTASQCGFTPQYKGLENLYRKYNTKGLVILGFPCNQFGNQEPGDETSIQNGCLVNYGVSFPMFSKIDVNGENAHPIFKYLKRKLPGLAGENIKWNFTKFIISPDGKPVKRFAPVTNPEKMEEFMKKLLKD